MSIFNKKDAICGALNPRMRSLLAEWVESANFPEENSLTPRNLSQKTKKGWLLKKLASNSEKLELNNTNLKLKSKKTCSDCTKKPDPSNALD
jgi:hypothetical protein